MPDIHRAFGDKSEEWYIRSTADHRGIYSISGNRKYIKVDEEQVDQFQPTIFLYDNYPGGVGLSEELFIQHETLFRPTLEIIRDYQCLDGCPACVGPPNEVGEKAKMVGLEI